jgi:hypothetical protein
MIRWLGELEVVRPSCPECLGALFARAEKALDVAVTLAEVMSTIGLDNLQAQPVHGGGVQLDVYLGVSDEYVWWLVCDWKDPEARHFRLRRVRVTHSTID